MREFLKGLDLDKELLNTIMAEHGKLITESKEEVETLKTKVKTYETELKTLKESVGDSDDWKKKFEDLDTKVKEQDEKSKAQKEDEILTNSITSVFGDKKFTSDYAKNGLIKDIKTELVKEENKGKGIKDIFESLTKDSVGIFENPNMPADMPGMGELESAKDNGADGFISIIQENQR